MFVRLAFAVAMNVDPEVLIVDEALAVGDVAFQRKCISCMESFSRGGGAILFASHSLEQIKRLCSRAIYLNKEKKILGPAKQVCDAYEKDHFSDAVGANENHSAELEFLERAPFKFPESAMHYGSKTAEIVRCWTSDIHGNRKSVFKSGEKILWIFHVIFEKPCSDVFYGLMIKTKEGINLFGTNTLEMEVSAFRENGSEVVQVVFELETYLGPGEYFLNCSVAQGSTVQPLFLHRIIDAAIIKISAGGSSFSGLVDMGVSCRLSKQKIEMA